MTKSKLVQPVIKPRPPARFVRSLVWAIFGAVLGNLSAGPMDEARKEVCEWITHARQNLEEGNGLRGEAVREGSEEKHKAANAAFERSAAAGEAEALAQLGIAHCYGWGGYARSWERGHAMLVEAVRVNGALAPIYFGDPDVCPKIK
jgi:TPR repeat protein